MSLLSSKAIRYIDGHMDELISLLRELCVIPAPSRHEERRAAFCREWLVKHGCEGAYIDGMNNVVWPWQCEGKREITCVAAHTDTVFPDSEPFCMEIRDGRAYCPAVGDDTVDVAMLMLIMAYVAEERPECPDGMLFALNACEEGLGNLDGVRRLFADWEGRIGRFITLDGGFDSICAKAVGSARYRVMVETEGGHSFGSFGNRNAIERLSRLIGLLYSVEVPKIPGVKTTYNVGMISGGTSVNTIAQSAEMLYEYRSDAREGLNAMRRKFEEAVSNVRPDCRRLTVELLGERPCTGAVNPGAQKALIDRISGIMEAYNGKKPAVTSGSTDCNWPLSLGIPAVCFGGYAGGGAHTREEYIELDSLPHGFRVVFSAIMSFFCEESGEEESK